MGESLTRGAPDRGLFELLERRCGSRGAAALLDALAADLGLGPSSDARALQAVALIMSGYDIEKVSRMLSWREFERFCANVLRASGFAVRENLVLRKPRRQVDVYGVSGSFALSVDCKHWRRSVGDSVLATVAAGQLERSRLLRERLLPDSPPIASAVLTMLNERPGVVGGVAVVSLLSLRSFLNSMEELRGVLTLV